MRILAISGSLQAGSSNTALLRAAREIAADDMTIVLSESVAHLPHFNPDLERDSTPEPVTTFRDQLQAVDGVLIASPEYAFGVPGALKNALDWLVGSGELYDKRVVLLSAAPAANRAAHARADLERTLRAQGARVLSSETVAVPTQLRTDLHRDPAIRTAIEAALAAFRRTEPGSPAAHRLPGS